MMNEPLTMVVIDDFAPVMLAAIRDILPKQSWTIYLILVYEILAQGSNQQEHATRLKLFLPNYPDIALFHNAFAELTHSTTMEEAMFQTYTRIPLANVPVCIPKLVRNAFDQLQARFIVSMPLVETVDQQSRQDFNMDNITQALHNVTLSRQGIISYSSAASTVLEPSGLDFVETDGADDDGYETDNELDAESATHGLTPGEVTIAEMEPSVSQARSEAIAYLESLNPFRAQDQNEMDGLMRELVGLGLK